MNRGDPRRRRTCTISVLTMFAVLAYCAAGAGAADREEAHYNVVVTLYNAGKWRAAVEKIDQRL